MKISMRTFSDSDNQFLHAFWESLDSFQGLFARYLLPLGALNLNLVFLCPHFSTSDLTLHPVTHLHQESFSRAHPRIGLAFHPDGDEVIFAVTLILSGVIT